MSIEPQQLHLGRDGIGRLFGIGGSAGTAAVDVGGYVMDFLAIFVGDGGVVGGAGVGAENYAVFVDEAYDCGAGFEGFGEFGGDVAA
jgi:hypothetical protein